MLNEFNDSVISVLLLNSSHKNFISASFSFLSFLSPLRLSSCSSRQLLVWNGVTPKSQLLQALGIHPLRVPSTCFPPGRGQFPVSSYSEQRQRPPAHPGNPGLSITPEHLASCVGGQLAGCPIRARVSNRDRPHCSPHPPPCLHCFFMSHRCAGLAPRLLVTQATNTQGFDRHKATPR